MRKTALILLAAAFAVNCASSGPPVAPEMVAQTEAAVRRAETAGARERAPDLLGKARRAWDEARMASSRGDGETARRRYVEAEEYAQAAEANPPRLCGYQERQWSGKLLAQRLEGCYGIKLSPRQCQRMLRQVTGDKPPQAV